MNVSPAWMDVHTMWVSGAQGVQKRASDILELELQIEEQPVLLTADPSVWPQIKLYLKFYLLLLCVLVGSERWDHKYHSTRVESRGQRCGVGSLLLPQSGSKDCTQVSRLGQGPLLSGTSHPS